MQSRPVDLNLFKVHFPVMAVVSILHRISGVVLFLLIPVLLGLLERSLRSEAEWEHMHRFLTQSQIVKTLIFLSLSALAYHTVAGLRHLSMDLGFGDSLKIGRLGAYGVLLLSTLFAVFLGVWLWA